MLDQILAFSRLLVFGVNGYLRDTSQIYGIGKPPKFTGLGYIPNCFLKNNVTWNMDDVKEVA